MKLSDTLLQQEGLSMAHDGATYCGTRGEYTFLILMGRNELVVSVLCGGEEPDKESFRDFVKARPELSGCKTAGTRVIFPSAPALRRKAMLGRSTRSCRSFSRSCMKTATKTAARSPTPSAKRSAA